MFERSFEHAPVGMLIVRDGVVLRVNAAIVELLGEPAEALVGRLGTSLVHPDDEAVSADAVRRTTAGEQLEAQDRRVLRPDGQTLTVQLRYSILHEGDGPPLVLIHVTDRTTELEAAAAREQALTEFETSFDAAPIGMSLVATDGRLLQVNDALCLLLARSAQELLSLDFQQFTHPDDLGKDLALLAETLDGVREGYEIEKRYLRPDGSVIDARLSVSLVRDLVGRPVHFISQVIDLTALRKASAELAEAKARMQAILEHTPSAIYMRDLEGRWMLANKRLLGTLDTTADELIGRSLRDTHEPEQYELLAAHDREVLAKGETQSYEVDLPDASLGELRHWLTLKFPVRNADGEIVGIGGVSVDTTERERSQQELAETKALFESAFEHAVIGKLISRLEPHGSIEVIKCNRALAAMLGTSQEGLLGHDAREFIHPADREHLRSIVDIAASGESVSAELRLKHRNGHDVWTLLACIIVQSAGAERLLVLQAVDLSDRKRAEGAREQAVYELEEAQRIARIGSWKLDPRMDAGVWSAEMFRIFGREPNAGAASKQEFLDYVIDEDRARVTSAYAAIIAGEERVESEFRITRDDGSIRALQVLGRPDPTNPGSFAGTVQDITERRAAETAVAEAREYAEAIIAAMSEGYALTVDGTITAVNDALCALTGFERKELVGSGLPFPFWPPEGIDETMLVRDRIVAQQGGTFEAIFMRKDGTRFPAEVTARAARRADGSLLGYVNTMRDISERKTYEAELKRLATVDALTGLLNQRLFRERLATEIALAERQGHPLSLAIFDLDHFKDVNDRYGHPVGDRVLVETAERLDALVRTGEHLARIGGEEFAWILPYADATGAEAAAERARQAVSAVPFGTVGTVTISAGVCELRPGQDLATLYQRADQALYASKQGGRNQTTRYGDDDEPS